MRTFQEVTTFVSLAAILHTGLPKLVEAGAPTDQVRQTADKVVQLLQESKAKSQGTDSQRRTQLRQLLAARFDFAEMAKRSLGANWQKASGPDQQRFVRSFTDLLENAYLGQIEDYDGEKIIYGREAIEQSNATVETKIVSKKGEELPVVYKLKADGADWKVYDVVIANVSLVNNYRTQFNRMLAKGSFAELLGELEAKAAQKSQRS